MIYANRPTPLEMHEAIRRVRELRREESHCGSPAVVALRLDRQVPPAGAFKLSLDCPICGRTWNLAACFWPYPTYRTITRIDWLAAGVEVLDDDEP